MLYLAMCVVMAALLQGVVSLLRTWSLWRLCGRLQSGPALAAPPGPVTVILPCRGLDQGFTENMESFFKLDYPDFQLLFVFDSDTDPAFLEVRRLCGRFPATVSRLTVAGPARGCGQKVHNLLHAVERIRDKDEVLLFADSDIRPRADWATALVSELEHPGIGLVTGFRWYLPVQGGFASTLRSTWNAGILAFMDPENATFAWGGAMACPRSVFEACSVRQAWHGALSDDLAISAAVRAKGYRIRFTPRALSFSFEDCTLGELLEWSRRQMAITRIYRPDLWRLSWIGPSLFGGALMLGLGMAALSQPAAGLPLPQEGWLLLSLAVVGLSAGQTALRRAALCRVFPERRGGLKPRLRLFDLFSALLSSLVTLLALLRSAAGREISWRGIRYRMDSPHSTTLLATPESRRDNSGICYDREESP